jgi:hypothetical protein
MNKDLGSKSSTIQTSYSNYAVDSCGSKGEHCMKGSIFPQKDRGRWAINWYCSIQKRSFVITKYKNHFMPITHYERSPNGVPILDDKEFPIPDKGRCQGFKTAQKLLASMQGRWEQHVQGICQFRIEEFTGKGWTDVLEYYEKWMKKKIVPKRAKATIDGYWSYYHNWIKPFFQKHNYMLHEIIEGTLDDLLSDILEGLSNKNPNGNIGKTAQNIMYAFHRMMKQAKRDGRIQSIPLFPEKEDYNLKETEFDFLWENDQMEIINSIPIPDRYPFLWLKYHYRRPSEACALFKTDYSPFKDEFTIQRSFSSRKLWHRTKTSAIHHIPCDENFTEIARRLLNENSESVFMFVNPRARNEGKHYTLESLKNIWAKARKDLKIGLYEGTKHSSCTQFINEKDGTDSELQMLTDHARMESVRHYRKVGTDKKRRLMKKPRVVDKSDYSKTTTKSNAV